MEAIQFKKTEKTPEIDFNFETGVFLIRGISIPENTIEFYHGLIFSIKEYSQNAAPETKLVFAYEYFNTSTSAIILKLISAISEVKSSTINIYWYYESDDAEMEEVGEDYKEMSTVPFELVSVENLYDFSL